MLVDNLHRNCEPTIGGVAMSKLRPGRIDKLTADYLALAKARAAVVEDHKIELWEFDQKLRAMQIEIERIENGGSDSTPVRIEPGGRRDALDRLPERRLGVFDDHACDVGEPDAEVGDGAFSDELDRIKWKARCSKLLSFITCILTDISNPNERRPQLAAMVGLFALGVPALPSKRAVARSQGVSPEWVGKRTEILINRFKLPRNDYNKPPEAVVKYQTIAQMRNKAS